MGFEVDGVYYTAGSSYVMDTRSSTRVTHLEQSRRLCHLVAPDHTGIARPVSTTRCNSNVNVRGSF